MRPLETAIEALHFRRLRMRQKAAWECELKPVVPQQSFTDGTYLAGVQ